ncbi:MAG: type pilus assembly protein PilB [Candidatus Hydrogenedentes bacterium]|nr:type pilus assembly protein PilB [Candidatus Hydrogenedentota bacterium]
MADSVQKDLFKKLEDAIASWASQDADQYRGITDQVTKVKEAIEALAGGAAKHREGTGGLAQQMRISLEALQEKIWTDAKALDEKLALANAANEEAQHQISQLDKTAAKRKESLATAEQRISKLEHDIVERGENILELNNRIKALDADLAKERDATKAAVEEGKKIKQAFAERGDAGQAAQQRVAKLERELAAARQVGGDASERVAILERSENELKKQVEDLTAQAEKTKMDNAALALDVEVTMSDLSTERERREAIQEQLKEMESLREGKQALEQKLAEIETLKADNKALEGKLTEIDALKADKKALEEKLAEIDALKADKKALEEKLAEIDTLKAEKKTLEEKLAEVDALKADKKVLEEKLVEIETLREQAASERERADRLQERLNGEVAKGTKSALAMQLAEALQDSENAHEELRQVRAELDKLRRGNGNSNHAPAAAPAPIPEAPAPPPVKNIKPEARVEGFDEPKGRDDQRRNLADILVDQGIVTREQIAGVMEDQRRMPQRSLAAFLIEKGMATETEVTKALASSCDVPIVQLSKEKVDPEVVRLLSDRLAKLHTCIPLRTEGNKLVLAMANPVDLVAVEDIERTTNLTVEPVAATPSEIQSAIAQYYAEP